MQVLGFFYNFGNVVSLFFQFHALIHEFMRNLCFIVSTQHGCNTEWDMNIIV